MYLQLFYLSIIIGFSYFLSFDFQFAKIQIISETTRKKSGARCGAPLVGRNDVRGMRAEVSPRWGFIETAKNNFLHLEEPSEDG